MIMGNAMVYILMHWVPGQFHIAAMFRDLQEAMYSTGHTVGYWGASKDPTGKQQWVCQLPGPNDTIYIIQEWVIR